MKRHFSILFLIGLLAILMPSWAVAQEDDTYDYVKEQLKSFKKSYVDFDKKIVTAEDAEKYENLCNTKNKQLESLYDTYSEYFLDETLFNMYVECTDLNQQLGKRIEELKGEKAMQERIDKLTAKLNRHLDKLKDLEELGTQYASNKRADSLNYVKTQAQKCWDAANRDYGDNGDFIEENEDLNQLWVEIEDTHLRITALEILKSPIDLTMILEIVGILAAVVVIFSMISAKIKAAQALKPKEPKKKKEKQEPDVPSI